MTNSTHRVEVVPVAMEKHPNADALSVVRVFSGYTVCVRTADWQGRDSGAYVPPDSLVDTRRAEFAFLKIAGRDIERIKVKRLRGTVSMGLLIPTPDGAAIGDDVAALLGVEHYEPPLRLQGAGECAPAPSGYHPVYDVESLRRYADAFVAGEPVCVTEKIHGANARFCFVDGEMHVGSRTMWKAAPKDGEDASPWWAAVRANPAIESACRSNPGVTFYGEVYGQVQDLRYGLTGAHAIFFDVLGVSGQWLHANDAREMLSTHGLPVVPSIPCEGGFDLERVLALAEGPSLIPGANHVREGVVVKPMIERRHDSCGRVCLKVVGNGYMERA